MSSLNVLLRDRDKETRPDKKIQGQRRREVTQPRKPLFDQGYSKKYVAGESALAGVIHPAPSAEFCYLNLSKKADS